jgi:hypothetical protein
MNLYRIRALQIVGPLAAACLTFAPPSFAAAAADSIGFPVSYIESRLAGPLTVLEAEQARPKIDGDRSARVVLAGADGEPPLTAKWKPVGRQAEGFNNEPRYELASYALQKLFLDECEYVVPPVVLRAVSLDEYQRVRADGEATLRGTSSVLFLLSYWLEDVTNAGAWNADRFAADPRYARHWGNLNVLTHLIEHKDANVGNLLISTHPEDPRVFAVDNDVAFGSESSDRGDQWKNLQVDRLPAATIERLKALTRADVERALGVLAEFRIEEGLLVAVAPGENMNHRRGIRTTDDRVQFGLTSGEINQVMRRLERLLSQVDKGRITAVGDSADSLGHACIVAAGAAG